MGRRLPHLQGIDYISFAAVKSDGAPHLSRAQSFLLTMGGFHLYSARDLSQSAAKRKGPLEASTVTKTDDLSNAHILLSTQMRPRTRWILEDASLDYVRLY